MISPEEFFALLSDETRLRCLMLLMARDELCVCELSDILGSIQPKISRHLSLLRKGDLVLDERKKQWVYYRLNGKLPSWMKEILLLSYHNLKKTKPFRSDLEKLSSSPPCP